MPPLTHWCAVLPYCPSYTLHKSANRCEKPDLLDFLFFPFSVSPVKHTYWLFPFKRYLSKISLAGPVQCLWCGLGEITHTEHCPSQRWTEMPFWSYVRRKPKKKRKKIKEKKTKKVWEGGKERARKHDGAR